MWQSRRLPVGGRVLEATHQLLLLLPHIPLLSGAWEAWTQACLCFWVCRAHASPCPWHQSILPGNVHIVAGFCLRAKRQVVGPGSG